MLAGFHTVRSFAFGAFSLLTAGAVVAWLFTRISLTEAFNLIRGADRAAVVAFIILSLATSFFRMWRYLILLRSNGERPPKGPLFLVVLVRNLFADLLPARLGTLVYIFLATTRLGIPVGAATSSFALSFLFDMLALAPIVLTVSLLATDLVPVLGLAFGSLLLALMTYALIVVLPQVFRGVASALQKSGLKRTGEAIKQAHDALQGTRQAGIYDQVLSLSVFIRLGKYATLYMFLYALLRPRGFGFSDLDVPKVFIGLCSAELAASLPLGTIAGLGAPQGAWVAAFKLLGFPPNIAELTSVSHILFTQLWGYSLGALAAVMLLFMPAASASDSCQERPPHIPAGRSAFYFGLSLTVLTVAALVFLTLIPGW